MLSGMKYFGGLTVVDTKSGVYYQIVGFCSYKKEKKLFHKPVLVPTYELVELTGRSRIEVDEKSLTKMYKVI